MEATTAHPQAPEFSIPVAHREAAQRYVAAIVKREPVRLLGDDFIAARIEELMERFAVDYASLGVGPYARHGADALRIALGRL